MKTLTVAIGQSLCFPGDVTGNLDRMEPLLRQASAAGARLALFGEGGVTGYSSSPECVATAVVPGDATWQRLQAMAREHNLTIVAGFWEREGEAIYNSQGAFAPDGEVAVQRKSMKVYPNHAEFGVPGYREASADRVLFEVDGIRCAISICADSGEEGLHDKLKALGVQLHLVPTAGCGPRHLGFAEAELDDPERFEAYLKAADTVVSVTRAVPEVRKSGIPLVACNQMADDGVSYFHPGHACIIDRTGEVVALIPGSFVFEHLRPRVAWGEIHTD